MKYTNLLDPNTDTPIPVYTFGGKEFFPPKGMPTQVKVYGMHFRVLYHSRIYNAPKKTQILRGVVLYANRLIILDPLETVHDMRETLYHEIGHVYLKVWQTKSKALSQISYDQMEDFCDCFGEAIYDLSNNNQL